MMSKKSEHCLSERGRALASRDCRRLDGQDQRSPICLQLTNSQILIITLLVYRIRKFPCLDEVAEINVRHSLQEFEQACLALSLLVRWRDEEKRDMERQVRVEKKQPSDERTQLKQGRASSTGL